MHGTSFLRSQAPAWPASLAAGVAPAVVHAQASDPLAPDVELPEGARHHLRRRRGVRQARSATMTGGKFQITVLRRPANSCRPSASSTRCRTAPSRCATPRRTTSSARTRPSRSALRDPVRPERAPDDGLDVRGQRPEADARVLRATTTSSTSRWATPARRWAAGSARRSSRWPTSRA
ncbi:MAG: hypothetical protein MZV65_44430 [Chromatiales bacterium]|nr:hypothetical protein [Chromatiales bacterium]